MSNIKKLASETMLYGGSTIVARFLNYLLTPYITYNLKHNLDDYGKVGLIYSLIPIFNIVFTYGFETAYFRFSSNKENNKNLYSTAALSLFVSTIIFTIILWVNRHYLGQSIGLEEFPNIIKLMIWIIAIDTLAAIPFAKLRQAGRPIKYASAKIIGILANIGVTVFYLSYARHHYTEGSWLSYVYDPSLNIVTYIILANVIQSIITLLFLWQEILQIKFEFNKALWKEMMVYSMPLILVGMGGVINDTMNRIMLKWWLPGDEVYNESQVGIFNACAKLAILITLFVQAFKMSAEPFFFKQAEAGNPQKLYARVMKFFVIILSIAFLAVSLFMPIWKHFIASTYRVGLNTVPVLLLANIFLGIYYNLTVWYKLSDKTIYGVYITLIGSAISVLVNYIFIPHYGLMACAWATFICYGTMMVTSYLWGQKYYSIPYAWKKLLAYLAVVVLIFFIHKGITLLWSNEIFSIALGLILTAVYCWFLTITEQKEFAKLPVVGKYFVKTK